MTLTFNVFGIEIAKLHLDIAKDEPDVYSLIDKGAKTTSKWFFSRMIR